MAPRDDIGHLARALDRRSGRTPRRDHCAGLQAVHSAITRGPTHDWGEGGM